MLIKKYAAVSLALCVGLVPLVAGAQAVPPQGSRPLAAVLKEAESKNLGHVTGADLNGGQWDVTVCRSSGCQKLSMDVATGAEKSRNSTSSGETLPVHSMPASAVVRTVESIEKQASVAGMAFDGRNWNVDVLQGGRAQKLRVNPVSGQIVGRN